MLKVSAVQMLLGFIIGLNQIHYSRSINCEDVKRVGSSNHVRIINPVCYPEGRLHYRWERVDSNENINGIRVDYNCSFSNSIENVVGSNPAWSIPRRWSNKEIDEEVSSGDASLDSCTVGGCYRHETANVVHYRIPSVTCSRYSTISTPGVSIAPTTSFMSTSIKSSSKYTLDLQPSVTSLTTIPVSSPLLSQPTSTPTEDLTNNGLADSTLTLNLQSSVTSSIIVLTTIPLSSPLLSQPTSTPTEDLTSNGLADSTLKIIVSVLVIIIGMPIFILATIACVLFARKRLRSRRRSLHFKKQGTLTDAVLVDACLPQPEVEEDTKTEIVCLDSVPGEILGDFQFSKTTHLQQTEPDNSSCSASESKSFTLTNTLPDVEAQADSESDHEENIAESNDRAEDMDNQTASDTSIKLETENEHKSSANVDSGNEHHIIQACIELDRKTDESLSLGLSHEHQSITSSFHNEPDILTAPPPLPIRQDHTDSSAGYVVMEGVSDDTLLYHFHAGKQ